MKREKTGDTSHKTCEKSSLTYSTIPDVRLRPGMAANAAARLILRHLLEIMRANEEGIKIDADIEHLHEYRIAVRRTRSALGQIRNVFPPEETGYFKGEFQKLNRLTNDLRNLDVFLAIEAGYRAKLPDDMREDMTPLFDYLRCRRSGALDVVVAGLESKPYKRFLGEWDRFLQRPIGENYPRNAYKPIIKPARRRINRQYHAILVDGAHALQSLEDEILHTLRIECKKLRYLLGFFAELFPPKETTSLLKQLKRLQDNLGTVSDLGNQRNYLLSIADVLDVDGLQGRRTLVATGALIEMIAREQQSIRSDFAKAFKNFSSPTHQKQFRKMIK